MAGAKGPLCAAQPWTQPSWTWTARSPTSQCCGTSCPPPSRTTLPGPRRRWRRWRPVASTRWPRSLVRGSRAPSGHPSVWGVRKDPCNGLVGAGRDTQPPAQFAQGVRASAWAALGPGSRLAPSRAPASGSLLPPRPWGLSRSEDACVPASSPWPERVPVHSSRAGPEAPLHPPPVCLDDSFGPDCSLTCDDCSHGGVCLPGLDGCDCPEGWTGLICNESEAAAPGRRRGL